MEAEELVFEAAFVRLEETVRILERGELPLNELVATYEEGVRLSALCNRLLDAADLRISQIARTADGSPVVAPLDVASLLRESPGSSGQTEGR